MMQRFSQGVHAASSTHSECLHPYQLIQLPVNKVLDFISNTGEETQQVEFESLTLRKKYERKEI